MPIPFHCPHCDAFTEVDEKYAGQTGLHQVTVALFVPEEEEKHVASLAGETTVESVRVTVITIGWM